MRTHCRIRVVFLLAVSFFLAFAPATKASTHECTTAVHKDFAAAEPNSSAISLEPLVALLKDLDQQGSDIRALLILQDCTLILERYKAGLSRDHNHSVYSVTKSVTSTLVGSLLKQRKLRDVDQPIAALMPRPSGIPDLQWERASHLTLKNVMNMASGFAYRHDPTSHPIYDTRTDRLRYALAQDVAAPPGQRFNYSDADVSITGAVVASLSGDSLYGFAKRVLLDPLEMANHAWWSRDRAGRYPGGWGLRLRPMDMLKLGQLYIQLGHWNGTSIFNEDYPELAWTHGPSSDYGLHWWIGSAANATHSSYFFADGHKGQRIYVFPAAGVVAVLVASLTIPEERQATTRLVNAVFRAVTSAKGVDATKQVKSDLARLQEAGFHGVTNVQQSDQDTPGQP